MATDFSKDMPIKRWGYVLLIGPGYFGHILTLLNVAWPLLKGETLTADQVKFRVLTALLGGLLFGLGMLAMTDFKARRFPRKPVPETE